MIIDQSCKLIEMDQRKTSLNSGHFRVIGQGINRKIVEKNARLSPKSLTQ